MAPNKPLDVELPQEELPARRLHVPDKVPALGRLAYLKKRLFNGSSSSMLEIRAIRTACRTLEGADVQIETLVHAPVQGCRYISRLLLAIVRSESRYNEVSVEKLSNFIGMMRSVIETGSSCIQTQDSRISFIEATGLTALTSHRLLNTWMKISSYIRECELLRSTSYVAEIDRKFSQELRKVGMGRRTHEDRSEDMKLHAVSCGQRKCRFLCNLENGREAFVLFINGSIWVIHMYQKKVETIVPLDDVDWCVLMTRPMMMFLAVVDFMMIQVNSVVPGLVEMMHSAWLEAVSWIEKVGLKGFHVFKNYKNLIGACVSVSKSNYTFGAQLENLVRQTETIDVKDQWKDEAWPDFRSSNLYRLILSLPLEAKCAAECVVECGPDPDLGVTNMVLKKVGETSSLIEYRKPITEEIIASIIRTAINNHYRMTNRYPELDLSLMKAEIGERLTNEIADRYNRIVMEGSEISTDQMQKSTYMSTTQLNSLRLVQSAFCDEQQNYLKLAKDTTSYSLPISARYIAEDRPVPFSDKRLICRYLQERIGPLYEFKEELVSAAKQEELFYNQDGTLNPKHTYTIASVGGSHAKSTENKNIAREFGSHDAKLRAAHLQLDTAATSFMALLHGIMLGGAEELKTNKMEEAHQHLRHDQFYGLEFNLDYKAWNSKFDPEWVRRLVRFIGDYYGLKSRAELEYIPSMFMRTAYHANGSFETVVRQGCVGAVDGMDQKIWTILSIHAVKCSLEGQMLANTVYAAGDDTNIWVTTDVRRSDSDAEAKLSSIASNILTRVSNYAAGINQQIKTEQMNISTDTGMFLGQLYYKGFKCSRGTRFGCKNIGLANVIGMDTAQGRIETIMGESLGSAKNYTDGRQGYLLSMISCFMNAYIWDKRKDCPFHKMNLSQFTAYLVAPIALGGAATGNMLSHMISGRSDPIVMFYYLVERAKQTNSLPSELYHCLEGFSHRKAASDFSLVTSASNPWSINCDKMPTNMDIYARRIRSAVTPLIKNPDLTSLLELATDENRNLFLRALANTPNMTALVAAVAYSLGSWTIVDNLINTMTTTTVLSLIMEKDKRGGIALIQRIQRLMADNEVNRVNLSIAISRHDQQYVWSRKGDEWSEIDSNREMCPGFAAYEHRKMHIEIHRKLGHETIGAEDTEEDCLEYHIRQSVSMGIRVNEDNIVVGTTSFRNDDMDNGLPSDYQDSLLNLIPERPKGNMPKRITTSGLSVSGVKMSSLPTHTAAVIQISNFMAIINMNGGKNTTIPSLLMQSYGIDPAKLQDIPLATTTDKTTRQHHIDPDVRQMTTGLICNMCTSAAVHCNMENLWTNTDSQPAGNFYFANMLAHVTSALYYRVNGSGTILLVERERCRANHCYKHTVDPVIGETIGDYKIRGVSSRLFLDQDDVPEHIIQATIESRATLGERMLERQHAAKKINDRLTFNPSGKVLMEELPDYKVFCTLRVMEIIDTMNYSVSPNSQYIDVPKHAGEIRASMGDRAQSRIAYTQMMDYDLLAIMVMQSVGTTLRKTYKFTSDMLTPAEWHVAMSEKPKVFPHVAPLADVLLRENTLHIFIQALCDLGGIVQPDGATIHDIFDTLMKNHYGDLIYSAENHYHFWVQTVRNEMNEVYATDEKPSIVDATNRPVKSDLVVRRVRAWAMRESEFLVENSVNGVIDEFSSAALSTVEYWLCFEKLNKYTIDVQSSTEILLTLSYGPPTGKDVLSFLDELYVKANQQKLVNCLLVPFLFNEDKIMACRSMFTLITMEIADQYQMRRIITNLLEYITSQMNVIESANQRAITNIDAKFYMKSLKKKVVCTSSKEMVSFLLSKGFVEEVTAIGIPRLGPMEEQDSIRTFYAPESFTGDVIEDLYYNKEREQRSVLPPINVVNARSTIAQRFVLDLTSPGIQKLFEVERSTISTSFTVKSAPEEVFNEYDIGSGTATPKLLFQPKKLFHIEDWARIYTGSNAFLKLLSILRDFTTITSLDEGTFISMHLADGSGSFTSAICTMASHNDRHFYIYNDIEPMFNDPNGVNPPVLPSVLAADPNFIGRGIKGLYSENMRDLSNPMHVSALQNASRSISTELGAPVRIITGDAEDQGWKTNPNSHLKLLWGYVVSMLTNDSDSPVGIFKFYLENSCGLSTYLALCSCIFKICFITKPYYSYSHNNEFYLVLQASRLRENAKQLANRILDILSKGEYPCLMGTFGQRVFAFQEMLSLLVASKGEYGFSEVKKILESGVQSFRSWIPAAPIVRVKIRDLCGIEGESDVNISLSKIVLRLAQKRREGILLLTGQVNNSSFGPSYGHEEDETSAKRKPVRSTLHQKAVDLYEEKQETLYVDLLHNLDRLVNIVSFEYIFSILDEEDWTPDSFTKTLKKLLVNVTVEKIIDQIDHELSSTLRMRKLFGLSKDKKILSFGPEVIDLHHHVTRNCRISIRAIAAEREKNVKPKRTSTMNSLENIKTASTTRNYKTTLARSLTDESYLRALNEKNYRVQSSRKRERDRRSATRICNVVEALNPPSRPDFVPGVKSSSERKFDRLMLG